MDATSSALTANSFILLFSIIAGIVAFAIIIYNYLKRKICSGFGLFVRALLTALATFVIAFILLNLLRFLYVWLVNYGIVIIIIIAVIVVMSI